MSRAELEPRPGPKPLDARLAQRGLRWAGPVYGMDSERPPRKFPTPRVDHTQFHSVSLRSTQFHSVPLTSWMDHPRRDHAPEPPSGP